MLARALIRQEAIYTRGLPGQGGGQGKGEVSRAGLRPQNRLGKRLGLGERGHKLSLLIRWVKQPLAELDQ